MAKKQDREWATRTEATKALAENANLSGAQLAAFIFHSTPDRILADAAGQRGAVIAAKRAQIERLTKEVQANDKAQATPQAPPQASKSA